MLKFLKNRWGIDSGWQVFIILVVFACTGFTVVGIKHFVGISGDSPLYARVLFYVAILPVYNVILLFYGYLAGQYRFFLNFEKKMLRRLGFRSAKTVNES